ncbi:hypothetical protein MKX01_022873 [Papaver californicum]|nr:hypothetical protein MKX01_022873 [Papaver californicum]
METLFRVRRNSNNESVGGKMSRGRRMVNYSPYARPSAAAVASSLCPSTEHTKTSWFSGFVVPTSRMIGNGAGKIISTVFGSQDSHSSSDNDSDDDKDEDNDSINEGYGGDNNDHNSQGSDGINQNTIESHGTKFLGRQPLAVVQRSEAKLQIERLLMQETFSRDECNRLTKIIQSRVVECHASREGGNASQGAAQFGEEARKSNSYLGNGVDSLSSGPLAHHHAAIMEAKKWLEEKKSESSLKLENSPLALTASPSKYSIVTEGEVGSPVLMAKTYMRSRPPWASPSSSLVGFRTPSPIRMHLVKEETPIGARPISSSKFITRSPLANDSQEILAELRRVRLKSEEAMLLSDSSIHIQPSASESGHKDGHTASRDGEQYAELGATLGSNIELTTKSFDSAAMIMENDGQIIETTSSVPSVILSNENQDLEDPRFKESVDETAQVNNTSEVMETEYTDDSKRPGVLNPSKQINGTTDRVTANGAPPSASSLSAGLNVGPENEGSSESRLGIGLMPLEEETCEPFSDASVEIPRDGDEEIDSGATGLDTNSSRHLIENKPTSRKSNRILVGKQQQEEKTIGKYSRRGRGRGKPQA